MSRRPTGASPTASIPVWRLDGPTGYGWRRMHIERLADEHGVRMTCGMWLPFAAGLVTSQSTAEALRHGGTAVCTGCLRRHESTRGGSDD